MSLPDANSLQVLLKATGVHLSLWDTQKVLDQIQTSSTPATGLDLLVEDMVRADQRLVKVLERITMDADVLNRIAPREDEPALGNERTTSPNNPVIKCRDWFSNPPTFTDVTY